MKHRDSVRVIPGVGTEVKTYGGPLDQLTVWEVTGYVDSIGGLNPKRTWSYDQRGRLLSETSYPTGTARTTGYAYDAKERPFQVTDPLGTWTTEYEANRGMPFKLKTPLGDTLTYTWDARGRPGGLQVASGGTRLNITHTWNGSGALNQRLITWLPTTQTVGKWTRLAAADANPAIATRWHEWKTGSTLDSISSYPEYDGWERLLGWDQVHSAPNGDETYGFDRTQNLTPANASGVTFDPATDQLTALNGGSYTYDAAGNLTGATQGGTTWVYVYDALNRLVSARRNSVLIARYAYDVTGRRMAKRVYSNTSGGTQAYTAFVYRGAHVAFDTDSAGTITWKYVWGAGTDDLVGFQDAAGNHYYAVTDQLGSVRNVLTRAGAWRMRLRYRPYGGQMDSSGPGIPLRYRWTGREWDGELKWYFHRARYYDPAMSRFVQEDPIGQAGGENLYAYVGGSPLEATDPSGLHAQFVQKGWFGCGVHCHEQGVYLDGIFVKNGGWLAGAPGIGFAGYGSSISVSAGPALVDVAWEIQLNVKGICKMLGCPSAMGFGDRRRLLNQLDDIWRRSNATSREATGFIVANAQGKWELSQVGWGAPGSGVDPRIVEQPAAAVIHFHTHPDVAPMIAGYAGPSFDDRAIFRNPDFANLLPLGSLVWQRDWVAYRRPGASPFQWECRQRFVGPVPLASCPAS
jgi:RHS repeat-associated protein